MEKSEEIIMQLAQSRVGKVVFARFFENEDLLEAITQVAEKANVSSGFFYLIGTLKKAKMGFFRNGRYETIEIDQPLEIVSCLGNVSIKEDRVFPHAHIAVSDDKGRVFGGHAMLGCIIGVTGELVLLEAVDVKLFRKLEEKTNLYMWSFGKPKAKTQKRRPARV